MKENWETLRFLDLGVERVIQSHVQGLKCGFENLRIKKNETIADFSFDSLR